ncbi:hypothetical protein FACS189432_04360 [Bacteroidia bacterium]|nr:hypothetical protein FACS189426_03980 [Bacteroidia bacterium]GHT27587.1 hypothetical protein FACS189432_04360 [Bacteroidia bacterium]
MKISFAQIAAIRLQSHLLSGAELRTPQAIVSWMGAVQAQDYGMAKWAIGARLPASTDKMIEEAFNKGEILRTHVMRPTWHFVSPEYIREMLLLSAEKIKASSRSRDRDLGITEELYDKSNQVIRKALEGNKHLTRKDLAIALEKADIAVDASRMVHFMMRAEVEAIICSGAMQGKEHTYALLDERVPASPVVSKEEALANSAQRYFRSHSPATLSDFVWWSGLSQTEAKKGLEAVKSDLFSEEIDGQTYWLSKTFKDIPHPKESVFLLPAFDEYIIAYRDRKAVLPSENHSKVVSSNGVFRPVIVVNGQVVGLWKKSPNKKQMLALNYFESAGDSNPHLIEKAIGGYKAFLI